MAREFLMLYPTAKILVVDETYFAKAKRQRFLARAATGNWDAIIITHDAFKFIAVEAAFERGMIDEQIEAYDNVADLMSLYRDFADVVQRDNLRRYVNSPAVRGGHRQIVVAPVHARFRA